MGYIRTLHAVRELLANNAALQARFDAVVAAGCEFDKGVATAITAELERAVRESEAIAHGSRIAPSQIVREWNALVRA